jgi:hypothetical protein
LQIINSHGTPFSNQRRKQQKTIGGFFEIVQNRTFYHFLRLMEKVNQFPMKHKTTLIEFYYSNKSKLICFKMGRKY